MKYFCATVLLLLAAACGKKSNWIKAENYFQRGLYAKALQRYEKFLAKSSEDQERSRAHLALARCYAKLGNASRARQHFEEAARLAPFSAEAQAAGKEMPESEDYLPLTPGSRWEEVDADTRGRNMYAVNTVEAHPGTRLVRRLIFAGKKSGRLVQEVLLFYEKEPGLRWERPHTPDAQPTLILRYPYREGNTWLTWREGRRVRRTITASALTVEVAGGKFFPCLEVAEAEDVGGELSQRGRIYDTYCAGAGRVRTAVGDADKRTVFSELALAPEKKN